MESDLAIFASQMHNIKVRYHIVGKQEELQEIYDLYQTFIQKERPAMEEDEADDWEGNIILLLVWTMGLAISVVISRNANFQKAFSI